MSPTTSHSRFRRRRIRTPLKGVALSAVMIPPPAPVARRTTRTSPRAPHLAAGAISTGACLPLGQGQQNPKDKQSRREDDQDERDEKLALQLVKPPVDHCDLPPGALWHTGRPACLQDFWAVRGSRRHHTCPIAIGTRHAQALMTRSIS